MGVLEEREAARRAEEAKNKATFFRYVKYGATGVAAIVALCIASCAADTVENGHIGLKKSFGKIVSEPLKPGLVWLNPFTTDLVQMDVRTLKWESNTQAYTKDVQKSTAAFTLTYSLDPSKVSVVYQTVGEDWANKLIGQVVVEEIKREFGQHEAVDLVAQRAQAASTIQENVTKSLLSRNIIVSGLQLTNIDYSDEFEHSVEAKVIAQQKAIEEQNRTVQIKEQANQAVETARGVADSTLLQAKAEAEAIEIKGRALRENQNLVALTIAQRWDGKLPATMIPGAGVPMLSLGNLK